MKPRTMRGRRAVPIIPYGYRIDGGYLVPDEKEQAVVRVIFSGRVAGASYAKIAKSLNEQGLLTRAGNAFTTAVVYNIAKGDT